MYKHILLPTDGSALSERAVKSGIALARCLKARVTGFFAKPTLSFGDYVELTRNSATADKRMKEREAHLRLGAKRVLATVERLAREAGVACDVVWVQSDSPADAIIEAARSNGCDVVFMASHGRRGLDALLLGSETTKVLTHSKIPVLVYR
jgi:nucleotide-binding universal stress UspA family protein